MISRINEKMENFECEFNNYKPGKLDISIYIELILKCLIILYGIIIVSFALEDIIYGRSFFSKEMLYFGMLLIIGVFILKLVENNQYIVPKLYIKIPIMLAIEFTIIVSLFLLVIFFVQENYLAARLS